MLLDWCSRFVAGATDLTLDLPFRPHIPDSPTIGGSLTSAAGIPASYIVREDEILTVTFRLFEQEYVAFRNVLRWGQQSGIIEWYPDALANTSYEVWLERPKAGERFGTVRDGEFQPIYEITVEFRRVDGVPWDLRFFAEVGPE